MYLAEMGGGGGDKRCTISPYVVLEIRKYIFLLWYPDKGFPRIEK